MAGDISQIVLMPRAPPLIPPPPTPWTEGRTKTENNTLAVRVIRMREVTTWTSIVSWSKLRCEVKSEV